LRRRDHSRSRCWHEPHADCALERSRSAPDGCNRIAAPGIRLEVTEAVFPAAKVVVDFGRRYRALMLKDMGDMCRATRLAIMGAAVSQTF
jgi:hypothetical protein